MFSAEASVLAMKEVHTLLDEAYTARVSDLARSVLLTKKAIAIAEESGEKDLEAKGKSRLGLFLMIQGKFEESLAYSEEALRHLEHVHDFSGIADAKYNIAGVYYKTDRFNLGFHLLLDCIQLYHELGDHHNESRALKSIGTIYEWFGDQENAVNAYERAIATARLAQDLNLESNAYNPLSGIYLKKGLYHDALVTIEKSISIKQHTNDVRGLAFARYGRGKIFLVLKEYEKAQFDLEESLSIQLAMGDKLGLAMVYNKLGVLKLETRYYGAAKAYLNLAYETAQAFNIGFIRAKSLYNLHLVYKKEGDAVEALRYLDWYVKVKEETMNQHTHEVVKTYKMLTKVTALEKEAEAQRDKNAIIERKNAELDSFFYRVSHDLKGPISSLLGLHNLVRLETMDPLAQQYFEMYQKQILRINTIVMDLINLTRMNHAEENKVKIDFESLVHECIYSYHYHDNFHRITFSKAIDPNIEYYSEWGIVNTILQNLIENSIKYAQPVNPFVNISIRKSVNELVIMVEDNGSGIDPAFHDKVFNMFFRANDRVDGTGLGLYILKRAVERLHGHVSFSSKLYEGSVFKVVLPLVVG